MTITYETLFEILRKEKNHEDLQKIDPTFIEELRKYVDEKNKALEKPRLDQFMDGYENEQNAIRVQIHNIKKIVRELFDRRERKIIEMSINRAKTSSNIVDTSAIMQDEALFFEEQTKLIAKFRDAVEDVLSPKKAGNEPKELNTAQVVQNIFKRVQVLENTPQFVGTDLEIYGPYSAEAQLDLKQEIAEMLIKTNKAKAIE